MLASASEDTTVRLWSMSEGVCRVMNIPVTSWVFGTVDCSNCLIVLQVAWCLDNPALCVPVALQTFQPVCTGGKLQECRVGVGCCCFPSQCLCRYQQAFCCGRSRGTKVRLELWPTPLMGL